MRRGSHIGGKSPGWGGADAKTAKRPVARDESAVPQARGRPWIGQKEVFIDKESRSFSEIARP